MCGFPGLDSVQEGQLIGRDTWIHWDAEKPRELPVGGVQTFTNYVIGSDTESDTETASTEGNINSDSEYDIGSDFESDISEVDWESENENQSEPQNMDNSQLTPRGMSMSPDNNVHVPASPIYSPYSPTSPDYSPSMSPLNIDSDTSEKTPTNSDGIISRKDCDMFDMSNSDSDLDLEGEAETKTLVGEFINRANCLRNYMGYLFSLSLQILTI